MQTNSETQFLETLVEHNKTHFFGVRFDNISKISALTVIRNFLTYKNGHKARKVFFTNVHTICLAEKDHAFAETVNNADLVLPDGSGLKIAGKIFSKPVKENLNGTDLTPVILKTAMDLKCKVYLLGAKQNVLNECVRKLAEQYPSLNIAGSHSGYFSHSEEDDVINEIKKSSPDIILIAMGSPRQEIIADKLAEKLENTVCFAVGGFFDFLSGDKKRAPLILRKTGLEWMYRFFQDPKTKWERIVIEIPSFLLSVIKSRFFTNSIYSSINRRPSLR